MKRAVIIFFLAISVVCMAGCFGSEEPTPGILEGSLYHNDFFGLSFELPEGWSVWTEAEIGEAEELYVELISHHNRDLAMQIEKDETVVDFVHASKYPLNYQVSFNPNFICNAENIKHAGANVRNGKEYLEHGQKLLRESGLPYRFEHIHMEVLDDVNFYTMVARIDGGSGFIHQKFYATIRNGYAINMVLSYETDNQLAELADIIDSVKFD